MTPDVAEYEKNKYERMWTYDSYRINSPGEHIVGAFLNNCDWKPWDSILDAGCGTGRAAYALAKHGLKPTLLDFVPEARDQDKREFPFINANLWDPGWTKESRFDWVFCADVMEHIPPDYVDAVLKNLSIVCVKGGIFQIAMFKDGCGMEIGEPLHLTIESTPWWIAKVEEHFKVEKAEDSDGRVIIWVLKGV